MTDYQKKRRDMINQLHDTIKIVGVVAEDKFISEAVVKTGFSERTIKDVLKHLETLGHIRNSEGVITAVKEERDDQ